MDTASTVGTTEPPPGRHLRAASALGWGTALVVFGLIWAYPDALARLRASFGPYVRAPEGCDPRAAPCEAAFADGTRVRLRVHPAEVRAAQPVTFAVQIDGDVEPSGIELQGIEMAMGLVQVPLTRQGDLWVGIGSLPACTIQEMAWRADVHIGERTAGFVLWMER